MVICHRRGRPRRVRRGIDGVPDGCTARETAMRAQVNGPLRPCLPDRGRFARSAIAFAAGVWCGLAGAAAALGDGPKARIEGGADTTGQHYRWTVTNEHTSPIVYAEFPHHRADVFTPPEGWTPKCRYLVGGKETNRGPAMCSATAPGPDRGITQGQSAEFRMRIAPKGAKRGRGEVKIRFADGTTTVMAGVELPSPETAAERYIRLAGFGVLFAVFLLVRTAWTRRRRSEQSAPPSGS